MATFKKGQSYKGQRVHVSSVFDQKGPNMTGKNVAFSISNDTRAPEDVITNPMLVYDKYTDNEGKERDTFTASYSQKQWEQIEKMANKDGDSMVVEADLFPNSRGKGLVINVNSLKTPEVPFNAELHRANTLAARAAKAAAKETSAPEVEAEAEQELEA